MFISEQPPVISGWEVIGSCTVGEKECEIYPGAVVKSGEVTLSRNPVDIWNGKLLEVAPHGDGVKVRYTANLDPRCDGDATILEIKCEGGYPFSVNTRDIDSGVYMEDYDILITAPLGGVSPSGRVAELTSGKSSVFDRVPLHDEQTVAGAFAEIPEMDVTKQQPYGRYVILGWEALRKKFCLRYNGDIFSDKGLAKNARRDLCGTRWAGGMLHFRISSGDPPSSHEAKGECRQYMPDARVPLYVTEWLDRGVEYRQTSFAVPRDSSLIGKTDLRGDEDVIIMNRIEIATRQRRRMTPACI